jgi:hypothetical protein
MRAFQEWEGGKGNGTEYPDRSLPGVCNQDSAFLCTPGCVQGQGGSVWGTTHSKCFPWASISGTPMWPHGFAGCHHPQGFCFPLLVGTCFRFRCWCFIFLFVPAVTDFCILHLLVGCVAWNSFYLWATYFRFALSFRISPTLPKPLNQNHSGECTWGDSCWWFFWHCSL